MTNSTNCFPLFKGSILRIFRRKSFSSFEKFDVINCLFSARIVQLASLSVFLSFCQGLKRKGPGNEVDVQCETSCKYNKLLQQLRNEMRSKLNANNPQIDIYSGLCNSLSFSLVANFCCCCCLSAE